MSINFLSDLANWIFMATLVIGMLATVLIWYTAKKKEEASTQEIATLSVSTAQANARAAALELKSEELKRENILFAKGVAEANARTATLELKSEELKRENSLLAKAVAPRRLEQSKSSTALKDFAGTKVTIVAFPDFESRRLAGQIAFMLELASWKVTTLSPSERDIRDGVEIEFVGGGSSDKGRYEQGKRMQAASELFVKQMEASSIDARTHFVPIGAVERGSAGQDPNRPLDELKIFVGLKPISSLLSTKSDADSESGIIIDGNR